MWTAFRLRAFSPEYSKCAKIFRLAYVRVYIPGSSTGEARGLREAVLQSTSGYQPLDDSRQKI